MSSEREQGEARRAFPLSGAATMVAQVFLVPCEGRDVIGQMVECHVAEPVALAQGGVDVVGADENRDEVGLFGDDLIEPLQAVPRQVAVDPVVDEAEARQRGPRARAGRDN